MMIVLLSPFWDTSKKVAAGELPARAAVAEHFRSPSAKTIQRSESWRAPRAVRGGPRAGPAPRQQWMASSTRALSVPASLGGYAWMEVREHPTDVLQGDAGIGGRPGLEEGLREEALGHGQVGERGRAGSARP